MFGVSEEEVGREKYERQEEYRRKKDVRSGGRGGEKMKRKRLCGRK